MAYMGGSSSSDKRNKEVVKHPSCKVEAASLPVRADYYDGSNSSDGEWDDLPPVPEAPRLPAEVPCSSRFHYLLNLMFVGDGGTGKMMLLTRFVVSFRSTNLPYI